MITSMVKMTAESEPSSDTEILHRAIVDEKNSIDTYIQYADIANNEMVTDTLMDLAKEHKEHVKELLQCMSMIDPEHVESIKSSLSGTDGSKYSSLKLDDLGDDLDDFDDDELEDLMKED